MFNQNGNLLFTRSWELVILSSAAENSHTPWRQKWSRKGRVKSVGGWLQSKYTSGYQIAQAQGFFLKQVGNKVQAMYHKFIPTRFPLAAGTFSTHRNFWGIFSWGWKQRSTRIKSRAVSPSVHQMSKFDNWAHNTYLMLGVQDVSHSSSVNLHGKP